MSRMKAACLGLAMLAFAGAALAQTTPMTKDSLASSAPMAPDAMSSTPMNMSKSQMTTMHRCQALSHEAMMKSHGCMAMMKAHPDMMKSDGAMAKPGQ